LIVNISLGENAHGPDNPPLRKQNMFFPSMGLYNDISFSFFQRRVHLNDLGMKNE
jgi:hypothetical protein